MTSAELTASSGTKYTPSADVLRQRRAPPRSPAGSCRPRRARSASPRRAPPSVSSVPSSADLRLPADEAGGRDGQVARPAEAAQRRELLVQPVQGQLVQVLGVREVLEPVPAEVGTTVVPSGRCDAAIRRVASVITTWPPCAARRRGRRGGRPGRRSRPRAGSARRCAAPSGPGPGRPGATVPVEVALALGRGVQGVGDRGEDDEEAVALRAHLAAVPPLEGRPQDAAVRRQDRRRSRRRGPAGHWWTPRCR